MLTLNIALGPFLVAVLLITDFVISPLKNLFKDELLYCGARHVVARGKEVRVRTTPKVCHAAGFETFASSSGVMMLFVNAVNASIVIFLIIATTLWERTIEQKTVQLTVPLTTTSQFRDTFRAPEGRTFLMSPFPVIGLTEEAVGDLTPFSKNGTDSKALYKVREDIAMANEYASACVNTPNSTHTVVNKAAVFVGHDGERRSSCLDGSGTSSLSISATFYTDFGEAGREVRRVNLLREVSTDTYTTVYAAQVTDDVGEIYKGYIAISLRSYFNADVEWSFYGVLRKGQQSREVWRISLPLKTFLQNRKPCKKDEIGIWRLTNDVYTCPSGKKVSRPKDPPTIETKPLHSAGLFLMTGQNQGDENSDLLSWMVEIDYARFWAAQTFAQELRERVRGDRMFYSAYDGETVTATNGSTQETVSFGTAETILVAVAVSLLLLQIVVGLIWKCIQMRKHNIRSEVVSYKAIAAMYQSEVSGVQIDDGETTKLHLGICDVDERSPRLGIISKREETPRYSEASWDAVWAM